MDKYVVIFQEPTDNLMINQKLLKETICNCSRFQTLMYSYDNGRRQRWNIDPIYKQKYTKKSYNKQNKPLKSDFKT